MNSKVHVKFNCMIASASKFGVWGSKLHCSCIHLDLFKDILVDLTRLLYLTCFAGIVSFTGGKNERVMQI